MQRKQHVITALFTMTLLSVINCFASGSALDPKSAWDGKGPTPAYVKQEWPAGRVLTWANPGESGELTEAANWLEKGKPAKKAPDQETDIILPEAQTRYTVKAGRQKVRHVDIFNNAELYGRHRGETEIWGNCWIHEGGYALFISIRGDRHAFLKNEGAEYPSLENGLKYRGPKSKGGKENASQLSHKFPICKYGTASIEFIGKFGVGDEIMLQHGRLILNGELRWSGYTGKGALEVYDGGILELQSNARIIPFMPRNKKAIYNIDLYRNGMLQAGSPERPLTADATVYLGFEENEVTGSTGLYAAQGSMIRVYSTDPTKHRLVFSSTAEFPDLCNAACKPQKPKATTASGKLGTVLQLAGDVVLDGVHFDYLSEGGLALAKNVDPKSWKNVTYGKHNAGSGNDLFSEMVVDQDIYYHIRGDGASEYAMVTTAVSDMQKYLENTDPFQLESQPPSIKQAEVVISKGPRKPTAMVPKSVIYKKSVQVSIECKASGARMRYTLDGTEPTKQSPVYSGPIEITKTSKLMAKAYKSGLGFSPTFSAVYVVE